jgi:GNAT superfamily N-acetyltransferase
LPAADADEVRVTTLRGAAIGTILDDLAALRIAVFRDFPYLYDGDAAYEAWYLGRFAEAPDATLVAAFAGERLVGAATAVPLVREHADFQTPFRRHGIDPAAVFYLAESVLLPGFRGRGIGHRFFDQREAEGRRLGFAKAAFCAVVRPDGHPLRPKDYRPLDAFWRKRGYRPVAGLTTTFPWKDLGHDRETAKPMQFWLRELAEASRPAAADT